MEKVSVNKEYTNDKVNEMLEKYNEQYPDVAFFICFPENILGTLWDICIKDMPYKKAKVKQYMDKKIANSMKYFKTFEAIVQTNDVVFFYLDIIDQPCIVVNADNFNRWQDQYAENSGYSDDNFIECVEQLLKHEIGHYLDWKDNNKSFATLPYIAPEAESKNLVFFDMSSHIEEYCENECEQMANEKGDTDIDKFILYKKTMSRINTLKMLNKAYAMLGNDSDIYAKIKESFSTFEEEIAFANCVYKIFLTKYKKKEASEIVDYIINNFDEIYNLNIEDVNSIKF